MKLTCVLLPQPPLCFDHTAASQCNATADRLTHSQRQVDGMQLWRMSSALKTHRGSSLPPEVPCLMLWLAAPQRVLRPSSCLATRLPASLSPRLASLVPLLSASSVGGDCVCTCVMIGRARGAHHCWSARVSLEATTLGRPSHTELYTRCAPRLMSAWRRLTSRYLPSCQETGIV
jgi:hypothetical protein